MERELYIDTKKEKKAGEEHKTESVRGGELLSRRGGGLWEG